MKQIYSNYRVPHLPPRVVFEAYFIKGFKVGLEIRLFKRHENAYYGSVFKLWIFFIEVAAYVRKEK